MTGPEMPAEDEKQPACKGDDMCECDGSCFGWTPEKEDIEADMEMGV